MLMCPAEKSDAVPQLDVGLHKSRTTTEMRKAMTPIASLGPTVDNPGKGSRGIIVICFYTFEQMLQVN